MRSLKDHDVYVVKKGRVLDEDDPPVTDIITSGLQQLQLYAEHKAPHRFFFFFFGRISIYCLYLAQIRCEVWVPLRPHNALQDTATY